MIGERLNNYEILQEIGSGGMGTVYLARHPFIDRKAAVKVLRPEFARNTDVSNRFLNEARAANAIGHPNIIDIIDAGRLPGSNLPYLMMELLEGESLAARVKRVGRVPVADAVEWGRQIASALAAAHAKGIVHRDLKPENLFLIPDRRNPGRELVKVLDFGIAKLHSLAFSDGIKTQTGAVMGTPPYMSPEQCRGVSEDVDHRTDTYALGIILYEMVCGAPPFMAQGFGDILVQHITRPPEPPQRRNASIPDYLQMVILRALEKQPEARHASMNELLAALSAPEAVAGASSGASSTGLGPSLAPMKATTVMPTTPPRESTTFSSSVGEIDSLAAIPTSRRWLPLLLGGAGVAALVVVIALWARGGGQAQEPEPAAAARPARPAQTSVPPQHRPPARAPGSEPAAAPPGPAAPPAAAAPDPHKENAKEPDRSGGGKGNEGAGAVSAEPPRKTAAVRPPAVKPGVPDKPAAPVRPRPAGAAAPGVTPAGGAPTRPPRPSRPKTDEDAPIKF
jgi:serine/threonine-protein kinase